MSQRHTKATSKFVERYNKKVPLGRMAFETDIVGTIIFLSSTNALYYRTEY